MKPHIVLLCSLDTKGPESEYFRTRVRECGAVPLLVDIGYGRPPTVAADIGADELAKAAGHTIEEIRGMQDTGAASALIAQGATILANDLLRDGRCQGIAGIGGASNATLATTVMKSMPVGMPKLMISSAAAIPAYAASFFGSRDITMMNALVDISGLNELTESILSQGAAAIVAMARCNSELLERFGGEKLIAVSGFRFAEQCSQAVMRRLEELGYHPIPFHAQGVGENAMEDLIESGLFDGVVDIVPAGLSEYLFGGNRAARSDRLEAAGRAGIPQVLATSGFDMISCGPISRRDVADALWMERDLANRAYTVPDRYRVEARTTPDEVAEIGRAVAAKLNLASNATSILVPALGWSSLSVEGADLYDPAADAEFVPALTAALERDVPIREIPAELNSVEFATALADELHRLLRSGIDNLAQDDQSQ